MFQTDLLKGKRILITGGGTGLGYSMGQRYLELGAELVICGRRTEVLAEAKAKLEAETGGKVETHGCDIRDAAAIEQMLDAIWAVRAPDVLVNNAAGNFIARSEELSPRAVDAVLNIVLHGSAYATLGCGRRWLAQGHKATVLSIITTYAWTGSAYVVPSAMAKAGVLAMTRSLAVEWGGRGIRLNAIAPGPFPTPGAWERLVPRADMAETFGTKNPLGRVGNHRELADLASFLVSDGSGYINGEVVTIDGGEWLMGAGQFNFLNALTDEDWQALKPKKKS
ncbi:MAG TPA: SDR family oxidoreductase [Hypericibacter adhaerens]|jgi:NAD(P)-dependent dehydrogenase (short-subunit alcohol dehydrogenase family)|uniref:Short-chain dehydrogenase n=1 Tax=Hypericibacter adhaerens TaxID=2602016 RepID=A0A5J6MZH8_9PROT|nr:SDR family oxidoreductase [Hypericibacter adhaerens]QEX22434.1 short-chain dehydrogenase [Hypericibacter adhaerens]HWA43494.1 SDR family oxidoreductase [Hypericibacter adhaerens]